MHVLVTRPEGDGEALRERLEALGVTVSLAPMIEIRPVAGEIDFDGVQALMVTSANALRAVSSIPGSALSLPLYAVGDKTAERARDAGFRTIVAGPSDGLDLVALIGRQLDPTKGAILHLAGDVLAIDPAPLLAAQSFAYRKATVYDSIAADRLTDTTQRYLRNGEIDAVILMSPRTTEVFTRLVQSAGLQQQARNLTYICLSPAVAAPLAPLDAGNVIIASRPRMEEVLALVGKISST